MKHSHKKTASAAEPPFSHTESLLALFDFGNRKAEVVAYLNQILPGLWDGMNSVAANAKRNGVSARIEERAMLWRATQAILFDAVIGPIQGEDLTMATISANPDTKHIGIKASGRNYDFMEGSWKENLQSALDFLAVELRIKVDLYGKPRPPAPAETSSVKRFLELLL